MSADENLNQRVQVAQQRLVDRATPEAQTGNLAQEPPQNKVRFEELVEEQASEGIAASLPHNPSSMSTTIPTSMQVDESDQDRSKRQKTMPMTDMELEGPDKLFSKIARRDNL